jgi:hypothetical protein
MICGGRSGSALNAIRRPCQEITLDGVEGDVDGWNIAGPVSGVLRQLRQVVEVAADSTVVRGLGAAEFVDLLRLAEEFESVQNDGRTWVFEGATLYNMSDLLHSDWFHQHRPFDGQGEGLHQRRSFSSTRQN